MRFRIRVSVCLLFCSGFLLGPVLAEDIVQIFPLQHRPASELLPEIESLLREGERVSAADKNIVLIASPQTIAAADKLILLLDQPVRQFLVQVRWVEGPATTRNQMGYDGSSGETWFSSEGMTLGTSYKQTGQLLRISDGEQAAVVTGRDVPYSARWAAWSGRYSTGYTRDVAFQQIRSGFTIRVNAVSRGQVQAEITPQLMDAKRGGMHNPAILRLDRLTTKLTLAPGEWIELAAFLPESRVGSQILAGSESPLPAGRQLLLRIDDAQ